MKEKLTYFNWTFSRMSFWILFMLWSIWSGFEFLMNRSGAEFIGVLIGVWMMSLILYSIFYYYYKQGYRKGQEK